MLVDMILVVERRVVVIIGIGLGRESGESCLAIMLFGGGMAKTGLMARAERKKATEMITWAGRTYKIKWDLQIKRDKLDLQMLIKCIFELLVALGAASRKCVLQLDWGWNPNKIRLLYLLRHWT